MKPNLTNEIRAVLAAFDALPHSEKGEATYSALAELRRNLVADIEAQREAVRWAYRGLGAPGNWGYDNPEGRTWCKLLDAYNRSLDAEEATTANEGN